MREILFRAWDKVSKKYREFDGMHDTMTINKDGKVDYYNLQNGSGFDEYILEQFTGLTDKNGFTKIFEGDIIRLDGTIGGNIYEEKELLKDTTNLIIKGMGTSSWATTEQEAIMRGCHYAE